MYSTFHLRYEVKETCQSGEQGGRTFAGVHFVKGSEGKVAEGPVPREEMNGENSTGYIAGEEGRSSIAPSEAGFHPP